MSGILKYSWNDIRDYVSVISPALKPIIDDLSPTSDFPLYVCEYPYGALIVDEGVFHVVNDENKLVPLYHSSIPEDIKADLDYAGMAPVGVVADNSIETYFLNGHRPIPLAFYSQGNMMSLRDIFESKNHDYTLYNISAGARTICMLPKITNKANNENLKHKYGLQIALNNYSLSSHWEIFKSIANKRNFSQFEWRTKIIFFSKKWFTNFQDKKWSPFYQFLSMEAWKDPINKLNQLNLDLSFYLAQKNKNLKPNPYLADTLRHLIQLGTGDMPGLMPAINDIAAPITGLQKTYVEDYGLKKLPVIMHSHHFSLNENVPIYYSLQLPTTAAFSNRSTKIYSKMTDLRDLKDLLNIYLAEIIKNKRRGNQDFLASLADKITYNFYHCEQDQKKQILNSDCIANADPNFLKTPFKVEGLAFSDFNPFFRGCISISKK